MEQKYFYFGVRVKKSIVTSTGSTRNVDQTLWCKTVYNSATDAANAAAKAMQSRLGTSFFIQGFDKQLNIEADGTCTGYKTGE